MSDMIERDDIQNRNVTILHITRRGGVKVLAVVAIQSKMGNVP